MKRGKPDGSIEALIEHKAKREAEEANEASAKPPGTKKSDKQRRIEDILRKAPVTGTREALQQLAMLDPVIWTMFNRRLAGKTMTFDMSRHLTEAALERKRTDLSEREFAIHLKETRKRHRPWQIEPLRDDHPHKAYKKARQVGISELSITETVCFLDQHPNTIAIQTFPRDQQLQTFATTRINPLFDETPRMAALLTGVNQVYTKRINQSHLVMRSAWESGLGEGVNADVVVLDEKDRMKPGVDVAFRESLSSSVWGWLREVSTPTLPNRGVDESWLKSDMREWFVTCTKCGMKQPMTHESIVQVAELPLNCKELPKDSYDIRCTKRGCGGALDRINGEWVAKRPNTDLVRGYHMPQMIAVWLTATQIMQKRIDYKWIQLFTNYVLGEVSMAETMLLTEQDFDQANAGHPLIQQRSAKWPLIAAGIDWGHKNWAVILGLNTNGRVYVLNAKMFEDDRTKELVSVRRIDEWLENFQPDIIIGDSGYGKDRNAYLLRRCNERGYGQFFDCRYNPAEKGSATFTPRWSPAANQVLVDRTSALKNLCRHIKDKEIGLASREHEIIRLLEDHLKALAPMMEEDEDGKIVETIAATADDHLAHALFYAQLGMDYLRKSNLFSFDFY